MSFKKSCWRLFQNPLHVDCIGEAMELLRQRLDEKNVYYMNPALNLVQ